MCNKPYIAKQIKYPIFVDTSNIKVDETNQFRYSLYIPFLQLTNTSIMQNKGFVVIIMKNPSSASQTGCDRTISKVCNAAIHNGYNGVIITNLFPYRATKAKHVVNFYAKTNYSKIMENNLRKIQQCCLNRDVVFAWGQDSIGGHRSYPNNYNNAVISITSRTFFAVSCSCNNKTSCIQHNSIVHPQLRFPLHGLRWANNSLFINY